MKRKEVQLDARKRILLGEMARAERYQIHTEPGDVIVLTPVVSVPLAQAQLWQNTPELTKMLINSVANSERLVKRPVSELGPHLETS